MIEAMNEDAPEFDAADEEQVAEAERARKRQRDRELNDLRAVLSTRQGRRFMWRLLAHCSAFDSVFHENPQRMAHRSGRQDVGHFLMFETNAAVPTAFRTMMQEHTKEKSS